MFRPCWFLLPALLVGAAQAQIADTPRSLAMGGAVRGDPVGSSALLRNPAGMSRSYIYAAEAAYTRAAPSNVNTGGLNIVDSKTKPSVAVGLAYAYQFTDSGEPANDGHDVRLAFAHPFVPQVFNVGLGLHYLHLDRDVNVDDKKEVDELRAFTLDAGLLFSPTPAFHIGVVGHNLINTDDPGFPRQAGGGIAFTGELFTIDFDALADFDRGEETKAVLAGGLEMLIAGAVPFRLGFEYDGPTDQKWASGGIGFLDTRTRKEGNQLNIAYRQSIEDSKNWIFSGGMVLFL